MDIRFLKSLITVVETGSIAGAARLQCLTPAAVSQRIQALERDMDCELLVRSAHTVKPTENCLRLIPRARKLVREAEALKSDIDTSGLSGSLRIGAIATALTGMLPSAIHNLTKNAPQIKLHITPGTSQRLYNELQAENLDAAILVAPPFAVSKEFIVDALREEPLLLICKEINNRSVNNILAQEPYISYDPQSWGGRIAEQYLADNGIAPKTLCELDALDTIHILVEEEMGVSLVPSWAGLKSKPNRLTIKTINNARYMRKIVLLTPKQPTIPKIIEKLKASLQ